MPFEKSITTLLDLKAFSFTDYAGYHVRHCRQIGIICVRAGGSKVPSGGRNKTEPVTNSLFAPWKITRILIRIISFLSSPYNTLDPCCKLRRLAVPEHLYCWSIASLSALTAAGSVDLNWTWPCFRLVPNCQRWTCFVRRTCRGTMMIDVIMLCQSLSQSSEICVVKICIFWIYLMEH
jgi:hypothetical protein